MKCLNCGNELREGAKFCNKCGAAVEEIILNQNNNETPLHEPDHKNKRLNGKRLALLLGGATIGVVVIAVVVLFVCGVFGQKDAKNPSDKIEETKSAEKEIAEQEEKDWNFVHDHQLVEYDDVVYYVDNEGLWKKESGSDSKLLSEGSATNLATDGRVIYYGVFNEEVPYLYGKQEMTINVNQYDMYRYDLKTGKNEKLTSFIEAGRPICSVDDIVYYTDYSDDFDGNAAGLAQGLRSYNMSTGEKKYICDGAHLVDSWNNKIFYRTIMAAGGGYGVHQIHCYDTKTGKSETISEDNVVSFEVISGKLYYIISSFSDFSGDEASNQIWIYAYDISSGKTKKLFEKTARINDIKFYDDKFICYTSEDSLIRFDLANEKEEKIPSDILDGYTPEVVGHYKNETLLASEDDSGRLYLMDDDSMKIIARSESFSWRTVLAINDKIAFTVDKDDNNYYFYTISLHKLE